MCPSARPSADLVRPTGARFPESGCENRPAPSHECDVRQSHGGAGPPPSDVAENVSTMFSSRAITRGIEISVTSRYVPEQSEPSDHQWFFAYTVRIHNAGADTVQLVSRHWIITDADGEVEEVRGPGVVGEQPILEPGQSFEYTSACPLATSFGTMHGSYTMVIAGGDRFDAEIAPFTLAEPHTVH